MTKEEQALRQAVADLKASAKTLMDAGNQEEAKAKLEEATAAKAKLDNYLALQGIQVPDPQNKGAQQPGIKEPKAQKPEYKQVFMKAIRKQPLTETEASILNEYKAKLSAETGVDGGFIVPEDVQTAINELKNTVDALENYVTVQPVSTSKGSRVLEKRADSTPFAKLSEYGDPNAMQDMGSPQFEQLKYAIEDYAGFLPVPNHLLADTDQALEQYLRTWIAKKSKATRNSLILAALETLSKVTFAGIDDIKKALNVTLDPAISVASSVYTNQDGFNYFDTLKDTDGNYVLQKDPTNATRKLLFGIHPVVVLSNKTIKTAADGNTPVIVGDLKEAVVLWDREQLSVDMTREGGNAWRSNTTEFRAIEREDVTLWDNEAVVYGQIDLTPGA